MIGEAIHHEVLPDVSPLTVVTGDPKEDLKEGTEAQQENRNPEKGWAVGVPYSAATARNRLRRG